MRTLIIAAVVGLVVGGVAGGFTGYSLGQHSRDDQIPALATVPQATATKTSPTIATTAATAPPPLTPPPSTNAITAWPASGAPVQFEVSIVGLSGSGLTRTVTAQLTNTGRQAAHNIWVKGELFSGNTRIKVNNADYVRVDIGTLNAGASVTKEASLSISLLDGAKLLQSDGKVVLTVYSDETTQAFEYVIS